MLYVYGSLMPLRILEEVRLWKGLEKDQADMILRLTSEEQIDQNHQTRKNGVAVFLGQSSVEQETAENQQPTPTLQPTLSTILEKWRTAFAHMENKTRAWIDTAMHSPAHAQPWIAYHLQSILAPSVVQSRQWLQVLAQLKEEGTFRSGSRPWSNTAHTLIYDHGIEWTSAFLQRFQGHTLTGEGLWTTPTSSMTTPATVSSAAHSVSHSAESATLTAPSPDTSSHTYRQMVPIGGHKLPPLPYPYDALEPYIDQKTMKIHHDKHHLSYVEGLNKAELALQTARKNGQFDLIKHWERELAFNGAGHYLHTLFWTIMSPQGGGKPTGELAEAINRAFGSFEQFQQQFSAAAEKVEGGGWAIAVWSPRSRRIEILQAEKHQNLSQWDVIPLLALDVWEHAYYLKHQNDRAAYIKDWWHVVNWDEVSKRYLAASQLQWPPS